MSAVAGMLGKGKPRVETVEERDERLRKTLELELLKWQRLIMTTPFYDLLQGADKELAGKLLKKKLMHTDPSGMLQQTLKGKKTMRRKTRQLKRQAREQSHDND